MRGILGLWRCKARNLKIPPRWKCDVIARCWIWYFFQNKKKCQRFKTFKLFSRSLFQEIFFGSRLISYHPYKDAWRSPSLIDRWWVMTLHIKFKQLTFVSQLSTLSFGMAYLCSLKYLITNHSNYCLVAYCSWQFVVHPNRLFVFLVLKWHTQLLIFRTT